MANSSSSDASRALVIDTSVSINLHASGIADQILREVGHPVCAVDIAVGELRDSTERARRVAEAIDGWSKAGLMKVVPLRSEASETYERLIAGSAADTLDDGEAATLAMALAMGGLAVIDEAEGSSDCPCPLASTCLDVHGGTDGQTFGRRTSRFGCNW